MDAHRCPECKKKAQRVATVCDKADAAGRIYRIPCYFCMSCQHEEAVPLDQMDTWARAYWNELPKSVRPPVASGRGKRTLASGSPDDK